MRFTPHRLLQLAAFLLTLCVSALQGRHSHGYHESWTKSNKNELKNIIRGAAPDNKHRGSISSSKILDEVVPNIVPIDHFRKPFDQFKWPWKNYREWKRHQKKIEDKIDRMLKPRNRRFPPNHPSRTHEKRIKLPKNRDEKQVRTNTPKSDRNPSQKKHKKKKTGGVKKKSPKRTYQPPLSVELSAPSETATRPSISKHFPSKEFPTGGEVLSVKYYSTNGQ